MIGKETKAYQRGVRMTKTVQDIVENCEGEGFNQKFENLVLKCSTELPRIEKIIKSREADKKKLEDEISNLRKTVELFGNMAWQVANLQRTIENAAKELGAPVTELKITITG